MITHLVSLFKNLRERCLSNAKQCQLSGRENKEKSELRQTLQSLATLCKVQVQSPTLEITTTKPTRRHSLFGDGYRDALNYQYNFIFNLDVHRHSVLFGILYILHIVFKKYKVTNYVSMVLKPQLKWLVMVMHAYNPSYLGN